MAVPPLLFSEEVMMGKGDVLKYVEAGTRSLIQYLAPQLEIESDPGTATRGGWWSGLEYGT